MDIVYIAGSCAFAAVAGLFAWFGGRAKLALVLALLGPLVVLLIPAVVEFFVGYLTPSHSLVWLYTGPIAVLYLFAGGYAASAAKARNDV